MPSSWSDGARFNDWAVLNLVAENNKKNRIHFTARGIGGNRFTDFLIDNAIVDTIYFNSALEPTGHLVTIKCGAFKPTVMRSGKSLIKVL
jgi:hypothetical protein